MPNSIFASSNAASGDRSSGNDESGKRDNGSKMNSDPTMVQIIMDWDTTRDTESTETNTIDHQLQESEQESSDNDQGQLKVKGLPHQPRSISLQDQYNNNEDIGCHTQDQDNDYEINQESSDPDFCNDKIYENQRGYFLFGYPFFSASLLFPGIDPPAYTKEPTITSPIEIVDKNKTNKSDNSGNAGKAGKAHKVHASLPPQDIPVPSPDWTWVWNRWYVEMGPGVDDQGWRYAGWFGGRWRPGGWCVFVRQRIWVRRRRRIHQKQLDQQLPNKNQYRNLNQQLQINHHQKHKIHQQKLEQQNSTKSINAASLPDLKVSQWAHDRHYTISDFREQPVRPRLDRERISFIIDGIKIMTPEELDSITEDDVKSWMAELQFLEGKKRLIRQIKALNDTDNGSLNRIVQMCIQAIQDEMYYQDLAV